MTGFAATSFVAFDCDSPSRTPMAKVSLHNVQQCRSASIKEEKVEARIITRKTTQTLTYQACQVYRTRTITWCGFDSILYGGTKPEEFKTLLPLTKTDCKNIIATGAIPVNDKKTATYEFNVPSLYNQYTRGTVSDEFVCAYEKEGDWVDVWGQIQDKEKLEWVGFFPYLHHFCSLAEKLTLLLSQTTLEILISNATAVFDPATNQISFDAGFSCKATREMCLHPEHGTYVWELPKINCTDSYEELFTR